MVDTRRNDAAAEQGTRKTGNREKDTRAEGIGEHRRGYGESKERGRRGDRRAPSGRGEERSWSVQRRPAEGFGSIRGSCFDRRPTDSPQGRRQSRSHLPRRMQTPFQHQEYRQAGGAAAPARTAPAACAVAAATVPLFTTRQALV